MVRCRGPLNIYITAQPSLLLSKSIHVHVPIRVGEKIKQVPIYQIPHTVLAHQRPRTVYIFFPRLYDEKRRKKGLVPLREEQNRLFFDGFIRPSIEKIGPHFVHHLPGTYDSVRAASRIAMESSGSAAVRGAAFEVPYSEENLPRLWSVMQEALDRAERDMAADGLRPGDSGGVQETEDASRLWQFGDAIFLCSYKDTKLWHQSSGSSIAGGQTQLVDVASELLPTRSGYTVLARRCCQYNTLRFLYGQSREALLRRMALRAGSSQEDKEGEGENYDLDEGDWQALHGRGSEEEQAVGDGWKPPRIPCTATTEYPVYMLRDSISITSEPRRTKEGNFNAAVAQKGNIKASRQDAEQALSQSIQRMASNLEDPSRGYGWRLRPAEEAWWQLIKQANRLSDKPDPSTPQSAASLYAIVMLSLRHFINHQLHALARILSAPLAVAAGGKIGLDMARSREQRGFSFFPKDVATNLLQVPQLVIKAHWLEEASLQQSRHLIDQQAEDVLGILSQLLICSYKEAAYLALFPAKDRRNRVPDIDMFEFTLAGVDCNPPGNHRFFIKHVLTYFAWAWTLADSDISRRYLESQHFRVEAKRAIKAFEQLSHSPFIMAQRFLCVLYYRFCQQVLCFPNPDKINGVISVTAKNGSRTVLCTYIIKPYITIPNDAKLTDTVTAIVLDQDLHTHLQQNTYLSHIIYSIKQIRKYLYLPLSEDFL
ncbi:hypothetical protein DER46DRAFT_624738 [Fusarium sp. MPI-SDFR-AT-0072]|nr:hypothetical protein DER46DRAFT_624738 [Fusarium sp. MPI-SDFR-AT-0072]